METTITLAFRSRSLFKHPLSQWAWLEIAPDIELPDLTKILHNDPPTEEKGEIDPTLLGIPTQQSWQWPTPP